MSLIACIQSEIIAASDRYRSAASDHYDFWGEHIRYVLRESLALAEQYGADAEITALGALLHDVALLQQVGTRKDHHINGAMLAEHMLRAHHCPEDKIARVAACVRNHRSSRFAETVEELCVADADILAHFDNILMSFNSAVRLGVEPHRMRDWLREGFARDYRDLSAQTRAAFTPRYAQICAIVLGDASSERTTL